MRTRNSNEDTQNSRLSTHINETEQHKSPNIQDNEDNNEEQQQQQPRRSTQMKRTPMSLRGYDLRFGGAAVHEPESFREATQSQE